MSVSGDAEVMIAARSALLTALEALRGHRSSIVLVGAQAIYLHTGAAPVALAESTKDSDLALDPRSLPADPLLEDAMTNAGFHRNVTHPQPGAWLDAHGVPVDLMVPEALAGPGTRAATLPPHDRQATRRATGLEAAVADHSPMTIASLAEGDNREHTVEVASPAALLVTKLHKLGERQHSPTRLLDKDAHDLYRLLVGTESSHLAVAIARLRADDLAGGVTEQALTLLEELFANDASALGSRMAGRAEEGVGDPLNVSASVALLASDLLDALGGAPR
jgi:hypothetical protein